jgi:valyl-tRNA synthetase
LVRDSKGRKFSKSLGNGIDPLDVIERVGADPLRFGLTWQATDAQSIPFGEEHIDAGRRFANKIWNASRLVLGARGERTGPPAPPDAAARTLPERWLLSRHEAMLEEVDTALEAYRFAEAAQAVHRFFWSELCDWALEVEKERLYAGTAQERDEAGELLAWVLERTLRVLHPFMPFVTEEVWLRFDAGESIVVAPWPERRTGDRDLEAEERFGFAQGFVSAVRRFRKSHGLADNTPIPSVTAATVTPSQRDVIAELGPEIERLANVTSLNDTPSHDHGGGGSARLMVQGAEVTIPLAQILDVDAERARLAKRLEAVEADAAKASAKLSNDGFLAKAPEDVVAEMRQRLASRQEESATLREQLEHLG